MSPSKLRKLLAGWLLLGLGITMAWAQEAPIGTIKTVSAVATVLVDGQSVPAKAGMPLKSGHLIKTGPSGAVGVTLRDNTTLSIGPDTEFLIDDYLFSPTKGEFKLSAKLARGSLYYVSGTIAKLRPEAVAIKTPTGMIGVRGTQLVVKVDPTDAP